MRADISTIVRSRLPSSCQASVPQEASHQVPPKIEEQCLAEPDGKQTKEAEPKAWQEAIAEEVRKEIDKIVVERKNNIAAAAAQPAAGPTPRTQHAPSPPEGANRPPQAHAARAARVRRNSSTHTSALRARKLYKAAYSQGRCKHAGIAVASSV